MSTSSTRNVAIAFTGDVNASFPIAAASNAASPAQTDLLTLALGANTITPPTGGATPKAVTIIPPTGNTATITLKGVTGDTGVALHKTDPTTIALDSPTATFVLTTSAIVTGLRVIWS